MKASSTSRHLRRFGVRVKDVSLYEYRVGRPAPAKTEAAPAAEPAKEEQK